MSPLYNFFLSSILAACVRFSQLTYEVSEEDGFAEVCIVLEGDIEDYISVYFFTIAGTAIGKFLVTCNYDYMYTFN